MNNNAKILVPLAALSLPAADGSAAATPPAVGDEVDITSAKAVVKSIEGEGDQAKACIELTSVNDQPVENAEASEPSLDQEEGELRNQAVSAQGGGQQVY